MTTSTLSGSLVAESSTPKYQCQLQDESSVNLAKSDIVSATCRCVAADDGTLLVADSSIMASINDTGLLAYIIPATYTNFVDSSTPRSREEKQLIFTINTVSQTFIHYLFIRVTRTVEPA